MMDESLKNIIKYAADIATIVPVIIFLVSRIVYKLLPYLKTRISVYKYLNSDVLMVLINYELIGSAVFILISAILTPILGKDSSWEVISFDDYLKVSIIPFLIFIAGIAICIRKKRENNKCKYINNIAYGMVIYIVIYSTTMVEFFDSKVRGYDLPALIIAFMLVVLQIMSSIEQIKIKKIEYVVYVSTKEKYKSDRKPVKRDGFYVIVLINGEKILNIPIEKVKKIEMNIRNIDNDQNS